MFEAGYQLEHPWALLLLLLPLIMQWIPAYKEKRDSIKVPFFDKLLQLSEKNPETGAQLLRRDSVQRFLVGFTWVCLVVAGAKPVWIGAPIEQKKSGRDLMIAVDLSGSMETTDFTLPSGPTVNRLEAVKHVLNTLAAQRTSDRLGLIVFGSAAYLQTPFTADHRVWAQLLAETDIGMAGQSTVFGDAIGLSIKLFQESDSDNRVLVILTDGNDTGSTVPPIEAAKVAQSHEIRIYTIAIGDPSSVGEEAIDTETLHRVSQITGGQYFAALDQSALLRAYEAIGELEPELYESISYRPKRSMHWAPIAVSLSLYTLYHLLCLIRSSHRINKHSEDANAV